MSSRPSRGCSSAWSADGLAVRGDAGDADPTRAHRDRRHPARRRSCPPAQAAALRPWDPDELLVVAGPAGFKDFWPAAIADSLARESGLARARTARPHVAGRLRGAARRRGTATTSTRWTSPAASTIRAGATDDIDAIAAAVKRVAGRAPGPRRGAGGLRAGGSTPRPGPTRRTRLPLEPFEVPLVPPSIPGMRLWRVLRERIRAAGGRVQIGESVGAHPASRAAASRPSRWRPRHERTGSGPRPSCSPRAGSRAADSSPRATGGSWSRCWTSTWTRRDVDAWLRRASALDPAGHPIEAAGIAHRPPAPPAGPRRPAGGARQRARRRGAARRPAVAPRALRRRRRDRQRLARRARARPPTRPDAPPIGRDAGRRRGAHRDHRRSRPGGVRGPARVGRRRTSASSATSATRSARSLRVTDLFPGPKYEGPQAQRFRLATRCQQSRARRSGTSEVAGPLGRLLLRLRLVHDRLPGRREDRRDEQPGPRPAARGQAAASCATGASARPT